MDEVEEYTQMGNPPPSVKELYKNKLYVNKVTIAGPKAVKYNTDFSNGINEDTGINVKVLIRYSLFITLSLLCVFYAESFLQIFPAHIVI